MKVIIIGAFGTAVNIADSIMDAKYNYDAIDEVIGFSIDNEELGDSINGYPILCKTNELNSKYGHYDDIKFIFSLYKPTKMKERSELLLSYQINPQKFYTFIHPAAYVSKNASIGTGTVILPNCTIHSNVSIGNYNIINSNVVIEHDTTIGNNNFIAAKCCIGSLVQIHSFTFIGLNSTIREEVIIRNNSFVGMASGVLKSLSENEFVFGCPAKSQQILKG